MNTDFATISVEQLDDVTGGGMLSNAWNWTKKNAGSLIEGASSMLGGAGESTSIGVQNGYNQRSAQGNTGPVSMGDGSPIRVGQ